MNYSKSRVAVSKSSLETLYTFFFSAALTQTIVIAMITTEITTNIIIKYMLLGPFDEGFVGPKDGVGCGKKSYLILSDSFGIINESKGGLSLTVDKKVIEKLLFDVEIIDFPVMFSEETL